MYTYSTINILVFDLLKSQSWSDGRNPLTIMNQIKSKYKKFFKLHRNKQNITVVSWQQTGWILCVGQYSYPSLKPPSFHSYQKHSLPTELWNPFSVRVSTHRSMQKLRRQGPFPKYPYLSRTKSRVSFSLLYWKWISLMSALERPERGVSERRRCAASALSSP